MLQRIQTLYLIFSIVIAAVAQFLSVIEVSTPGETDEVTPWLLSGDKVAVGGWPLGIIWFVFVVINVFTILSYKDRIKQMKYIRISYFMLLLIILFETAIIYLWYRVPEVEVSYGSHIIMPLVAFIFNFMARKMIRKDEELVKSVDRLR